MDSRQSKKILLIGCDNDFLLIPNCIHHHPKKDFITVDYRSARNPDVVADVTDLPTLVSELGQKIFQPHLTMSSLNIFRGRLLRIHRCLNHCSMRVDPLSSLEVDMKV